MTRVFVMWRLVILTVALFVIVGLAYVGWLGRSRLPPIARTLDPTANPAIDMDATVDSDNNVAIVADGPRNSRGTMASMHDESAVPLFSAEGFVPQASSRLKSLNVWLRFGGGDSAEALHSIDWVPSHFSCSQLRPVHRQRTYQSADYEVWRADARKSARRYEGAAGLRTALGEMCEPFTAGQAPHYSLHIYEVTPREETIVTRVHVEVDGVGKGALIEQDAHWIVSWKLVGREQQPELLSIEVESFEEVLLHREQPWFSDCTQSVFRRADSFAEQFAYSNTHWRRRIERHHIIDKSGHHGVAIGDVNGDGLDDVYVCQPGGLPNRLYLNQPDGTVNDVSSMAGCDFLDNTRSALLIDFDNDGSQDLILATVSGILFLKNVQGHFSLANNIPAIVDAYSMAAADYDNDGDLDIYACRYYQANADPLALPIPSPYFDARNGGQNYLIRNLGNWQTSNATAECGLDENNDRFSYAAIWIDYDKDGDQDLYVANDFGRNNLYRNDITRPGESRFTDVAMQLGLEDGAFGMAATGADYDRDGWEDIYVANMFSSAGSRISRMPDFKPGISRPQRAKFQHLARGNTLVRNMSGRRFKDVSVQAGVTMGRWSWGSLFVDIDNNGWQDLIVANGYITGDKAQDDL